MDKEVPKGCKEVVPWSLDEFEFDFKAFPLNHHSMQVYLLFSKR